MREFVGPDGAVDYAGVRARMDALRQSAREIRAAGGNAERVAARIAPIAAEIDRLYEVVYAKPGIRVPDRVIDTRVDTPHRMAVWGNSALVGTVHLTDPDAPQSKDLMQAAENWARWTRAAGLDGIVLHEGRPAEPGVTARESLSSSRGESALLAYVARRHGIPVASLDRSPQAELQALNARFGWEATLLYVALRQLPQGWRAQAGSRPDPQAYQRFSVGLAASIVPPGLNPHTEFARLIKHDYPELTFPEVFGPRWERFFLRESVDPIGGVWPMSRAQEVAKANNEVRDAHAAGVLAGHLRAGRPFLAAFGEPHFDAVARQLPPSEQVALLGAQGRWLR